ncbi:energy-coupling factor transport system ATP-binding protein [Mycoplasmoides fastidiosum]|uniref:Energy-coupling factor transport system ATP-binding protein n=1 Tax=Mycoplasmoides fastidiosum TaxID=92758 RepID=A0ABU0M053_9BACT|nr:ATP-binding cassette domain-containing protein [Mycoplasmoides fastidiosum]MDQ0514323.1 energy-coupling factor transport system ATP-binding protein [Mycoplasmoides fastidiosum]UUD38074.1 ATP-binding cassette domain-containing protein [Mycoplasmoides fastidiosum]
MTPTKKFFAIKTEQIQYLQTSHKEQAESLLRHLFNRFKWSYLIYFTSTYRSARKAAIEFTKNFRISDDDAIVVQDLNAYYTDFHLREFQVLKNINFTFKKNKIYCIIGNSGSGKTTLANHFNGLLKSAYGNVYLTNENKILFYQKKIRNYKKIRLNIGSVMQSPENQLFKETVLKDVSFGPKILGIPKDEILARSATALLDMGIGENFFNSNPFNLSGGQKRKVALAGILAIDPRIIIFDEPTVGLDPYSEKKTIEMIANLKQDGRTLIVISHNMDHVLEIADHVILLDKGEIVHEAPTFEFFQNYQLLDKLNIALPRIITSINQFVKKDQQFCQLWNLQPRTVTELAQHVAQIFLAKD